MSLPTITVLEECADFSKTVEPFIPQLYELPRELLDRITNPGELLKLYVETNPLVSAFAFSLFLGLLFFILAELNQNYSQVDRAWSILPNIYIIHFAVWARLAGVSHQRLDLAAVFSIIWSVWPSI
jgi:hypothetical protein